MTSGAQRSEELAPPTLLGRFALLHLNSWAGHTTQRVEVLRQGKRRSLITTADGKQVRLPGKSRLLQPGESAWVMTYALSRPNGGGQRPPAKQQETNNDTKNQ